MGVASCGKTTIGSALAQRLGVRFIEGDQLHAPQSIAKMSRGEALNDLDRWPWLQRVGQQLRGRDGAVISCSALKRSYREAIAQAAERRVFFVHLHGAHGSLARRIAGRKGHFMPASLLDSQIATLEMPGPDEAAITIDIDLPPDAIIAAAEAYLRKEMVHEP